MRLGGCGLVWGFDLADGVGTRSVLGWIPCHVIRYFWFWWTGFELCHVHET